MKTKHVPFGRIFVKQIDEEQGTISAIVSVFGNVDSAKERVVSGAFKKTLESKFPVGVWMHDWSKPIASTIEAKEVESGDAMLPDELKDLGGLYIKGKFNLELTPAGTPANPDAYRAWSDIKAGIITEYSIGYTVKQSQANVDAIDLLEIELYEWSPVLVGANRATQTLDVKSLLEENFDTHLQTLDTAVKQALERVTARLEMREKAGRTFSQSNYNTLREYAETLKNASNEIIKLLESSQPETQKNHEYIQAEILKLKIQLQNIEWNNF